MKLLFAKEASGIKEVVKDKIDNLTVLTLAGFKDAQLQASQNAASILAKLCECCCEIKEAIGRDGDETRELINSINTQSLRDKLKAAEDKLLAISVKTGVVV